jgi:hypothetical protein
MKTMQQLATTSYNTYSQSDASTTFHLLLHTDTVVCISLEHSPTLLAIITQNCVPLIQLLGGNFVILSEVNAVIAVLCLGIVVAVVCNTVRLGGGWGGSTC